MSSLPPSDPRSPRDNPLGFDELIAIVVTFSTIGTILLVSLMRDDPKFFDQLSIQSSPSPQLSAAPATEKEAVPATSTPATSKPATSTPATSKPATSVAAIPVPATSTPANSVAANSAPATSTPANSAPATPASATPAPAAIVAVPTPQQPKPTATAAATTKPEKSPASTAKPVATPAKKPASPSSSLPVKPLPIIGSIETDVFRDVPKEFWARPYVNSIAQRGIVSGFADKTYRPTKPVTRAEFAAIVSKTFQAKTTRPAVKFSDVPSNHWAAGKIEQATRSGFLTGEPPLLKPYQPMTRLDVLVSLANGLGLKPKSDPAKILKVYQDADKIPKAAREKVAAATEMGLGFKNPNGKLLNPTQNASRADVADVIYKALVIDGQAEKKPPQKPAQ